MSTDIVPTEPVEPPDPSRAFKWTKLRLKVAELTVDGCSVKEIEERTGASYAAIIEWRKKPEFWDRVEVIKREVERAAVGLSIANRLKRITLYDELKRNALFLKGQRADQAPRDPNMHLNLDIDDELVAGAETGMIIHQVKTVGSGPMAEIVHEYSFDHQLIKTITLLDDQASKYLGEKAGTLTVQGDPDKPIKFTMTIDRPRGQILEGETVPDEEDGDFRNA